MILIVLTGLGLGFLTREERGAPRIRIGPLSLGPAMGVIAGTGVPAPSRTEEIERETPRVAPTSPELAACPLQGEGDWQLWVLDPEGMETHYPVGSLHRILTPETTALDPSGPERRAAPVEMLERLLNLEARLALPRLRLVQEGIS